MTKQTKKKVEKIMPEKIEKNNKNDWDNSEEPSWYHYVVIVLVFLLVITIFVKGFNYFENKYSSISNQGGNTTFNDGNVNVIFYDYPYKVGKITYHIKFRTDPEILETLDYVLEPSKLDLLNSKSLTFSFMEYNGTDNGQITIASSMLINTFKLVYKIDLSSESIVDYKTRNCSTSTNENKVITFNPYSNKTGVFMDEQTGCIEFETSRPDLMPQLVDKYIYNLINQE